VDFDDEEDESYGVFEASDSSDEEIKLKLSSNLESERGKHK